MGCGRSSFLKKLVAKFLVSGDCPSGQLAQRIKRLY